MPNTHRSIFRNTDRELNAALDEIGVPGAKAPKKIPVGITAPRPKRTYRSHRLGEKYAAKPLGDFDASTARGVKTRMEREICAEIIFSSGNPEDELIEKLDAARTRRVSIEGHELLNVLFCAIADR